MKVAVLLPAQSCCGAPALHADLIDAPGEQRQIVLGVDDALQKVHWRQRLKMPRSDLARLCVASLLLKDEGGFGSMPCWKCCWMGLALFTSL